jgi:carboxymethylenebutenolidase
MELRSTWIRFGPSEEWSGYFVVATHAKTPVPSIVLFQDIWGVDAHIEDVASRFAVGGYAVLAPDLFAINGARRPGLDRKSVGEALKFMNSLGPGVWQDPARREAALAALPAPNAEVVRGTLATLFGPDGPLGAAQHLPIARSAVDYLRHTEPATAGEPVSSVGFCLGGAISGLLGCHEPDLKLAAVFYGASPSTDLASRACPMIGFYGGEDARVNGTVPAFANAMAAAGRTFETHTYPRVHHAFFNDTRPSYDHPASRDAFARLLMALRPS